MKPVLSRCGIAATLPLLCLLVTGTTRAQTAWVEPSLAVVPPTVANFPQREGLKLLQPQKEVVGTLATISNGILALRPLPEAAGNYSNGLLKAYFVPLTLGTGQRAYGPRILPDGSAVIFRVAASDGNFHLYKFHIKERTLKRLTEKPLAFDRIETTTEGNQAVILRGVDATGAPVTPGSGQLVLLDLATGKESPLAKSDAAGFGGWAFLNPGTVVYSAIPANETFPALYSVSTAKPNTSKLLAKMAWRPLPSPDGARLAFFGAENPTTPDDSFRLSSRWDQNPRGAFVSVMNSDGTGRKGLWRQDGAYPLLQWSDAGLVTLKNRRWIADLGEHRIDRYDATRVDDYKGGLFGTLNLEGGWKWTALVTTGSIADYGVYQVYPTTKIDYDFTSLGQSGDGKRNYFTTRTTKHDADGDKKADALWMRYADRQFITISEFEGSDGMDFHDESGPNARPTGIAAIIERYPQGEAIAAAAYKANQATQNTNVEAGIVALRATLPDQDATRKATYAILEAKAGAPIVAPAAQEDAWEWLKTRTAELFPQADKAQRNKNSMLLTGEALHVAEQLLASPDTKKRQMGFDLAKNMAEGRLGFGQSDALRGVLLGWLYPNIELSRSNGQLIPVLNNLVQGTQLEPAINIAVIQLQLAGTDDSGLANSARLRLVAALGAAKRFDEAQKLLDQITDPAIADKVAKQKAALDTLRAAG